MATVTVGAEDEPVAAAGLADPRFLCRQALHELLELADLMELPYLLGSANVPPSDENPRQGQPPLTKEPPELGQEPRVHRQIPLVYPDAEASEDRLHRPAGLERGPHHAQAGVVDDDAGWSSRGRRGR